MKTMNMKVKTFILWFAGTLIGTVCFAEDTEPSAIFKKVIAAYDSMETYSSEGTIISDVDSDVGKMKSETSFSMKLKKPNLYLIEWDQKNSMMPAMSQAGAVWKQGPQPYLYMGVTKAYSKMNADDMALGSATGISGGAAFTIPSLFLSVFKGQPATFSGLVAPQLTGNEQVDGEECYVVSGSSPRSRKETFWISKKAYLIRKYSRSLEAPEGGLKVPKVTDRDLEEAARATGQDKEAMRRIMKQAEETTKTAKLKGTSTEFHGKIRTPKLAEDDFVFKVPVGVVLKDSIFGGALNSK